MILSSQAHCRRAAGSELCHQQAQPTLTAMLKNNAIDGGADFLPTLKALKKADHKYVFL